jgi:hypothetical protein
LVTFSLQSNQQERSKDLIGTWNSLSARTAGLTGIDVSALAPAGTVVDIGERGVEVSIGLNQIRFTVCSEIDIHIVYVDPVTQYVVWENAAVAGVASAALVTR